MKFHRDDFESCLFKTIQKSKLRKQQYSLLLHHIQRVQMNVFDSSTAYSPANFTSVDPPYLSPAAHGLLPWRRTTLREKIPLFNIKLFPICGTGGGTQRQIFKSSFQDCVINNQHLHRGLNVVH